ncbi:MAG TPA: BadF/BadG/BcrA/BcrD ATPase family protein [Bacteroidia bacterium]|nr:BadF/BadG/BcrA/BcrD ATPase family protein [Bacteroidia bacterium]
MILLADSGSTKTTWVLLNDKKQVAESHTQGFSPSFQKTETIASIMRAELGKEILQEQKNNSLQIFYYGTGCSTEEKKQIVSKALASIFTEAKITINHDLLASALALCGNKPGIACILGTGSNSCYFDGKEIKENLLSLGYFFGDHGSGAHLGKTLLQNYLDGNLPKDLESIFSVMPEFDKEHILHNVYKEPLPQRFLASYTKIMGNYMQHDFIKNLVKQCFADFFIHQVEKYSLHKQVKINFVGSVAFHFQKQLHEVMSERGLQEGIILQSPMEGLVNYHIATGV